VDRYLPPPSEKPEEVKEAEPQSSKKIDYTPLRKLVLDGSIRAGELKIKGARVHDVLVKLKGRNGVLKLDPLNLNLYEGGLTAKGVLDVRQQTPGSRMEFELKDVAVMPLLKDFAGKDFMEGTMHAQGAIRMKGEQPEMIKKTLNGQGDFRFNDGALVGFDLTSMVRNAKAAFGLAEKAEKRPRTDFSELNAPFTITNGNIRTEKTSLTSPVLRVLAKGDANLVTEALDFRVEPKFVATLKGQGDISERSGITVPVLVTGSFSSPKFRPDLKGMLKKGIGEGLPEPSELKKLIPGEKPSEEGTKDLEEKAKGLLKGLPFGK
jgi:AsmA protein